MSVPKLRHSQVQHARRLYYEDGLCPKCVKKLVSADNVSQSAFSEMLHYYTYKYVKDTWLEK